MENSVITSACCVENVPEELLGLKLKHKMFTMLEVTLKTVMQANLSTFSSWFHSTWTHGKFSELQGGLSAVADQRTNKLGCIKMMLREAAGWGRGCCSQCGGEWMMPGATCTGQTPQAASAWLESRFPCFLSSHSACLCDWVPVCRPGFTSNYRRGSCCSIASLSPLPLAPVSLPLFLSTFLLAQ